MSDSKVPDEIENVYQCAQSAANSGRKDLAKVLLMAYKKLLNNWLDAQYRQQPISKEASDGSGDKTWHDASDGPEM